MKVVGWLSLFGVGLGVGLTVGLGAPARAQTGPYGGPPVVAPPPAVPDSAITADIHAKLEQIRLLRQAQVTIATKDGVVTLVGTIPSEFARTQALDAARAVPGVVRVDDKLRLDVSSPQAPSRN
jgi:hyperosmotically inducible protein